MIRLERVGRRTFKTIADMHLSPEQNRFVVPNVVSLAQAWLYYEEARPFAILEGERTVGVWRSSGAKTDKPMRYGG